MEAFLRATEADAFPDTGRLHAFVERSTELFMSLLRGILIAAADSELVDDGQRVLRGVVVHVCCVVASHTTAADPMAPTAPISGPSDDATVCAEAAHVAAHGFAANSVDPSCVCPEFSSLWSERRAVELSQRVASGSVNPFSLNAVLFEALSCGHPNRAEAALWALEHIVRTSVTIEVVPLPDAG